MNMAILIVPCECEGICFAGIHVLVHVEMLVSHTVYGKCACVKAIWHLNYLRCKICS